MASLALRPISLRMLSASTFKLAETRARIIPVWATSAAAPPFFASDPGVVTWAFTFFVIARPPQCHFLNCAPIVIQKQGRLRGVDVRGLWLGQRAGTANSGWVKGVAANSLRNLAEIGNQPVDGTRRDPRWSLGGKGRAPRGTVPGGLNPHSGVGSGGLGCHDDHPRLLGQPHSRVEQAHHPVLHYPRIIELTQKPVYELCEKCDERLRDDQLDCYEAERLLAHSQ